MAGGANQLAIRGSRQDPICMDLGLANLERSCISHVILKH